jgi:electron transfer flavoprotein alpha subunit
MRIAALVKQIPAFEEMALLSNGRLRREGLDLEMNAFCRRAVSEAVALAAEDPQTSVLFVTLGPPSAEDVLREALAWALARGARAEGLLVSDPAFAGSDTLATARALATVLRDEGPFDLIFTGRNSLDADTGQVGPAIAGILDLPFVAAVRELAVSPRGLDLRAERDDGWMRARIALPAILSTAERLIEPCKVDPPERAEVPASLIRTVSVSRLGDGPWGAEGSPTWVGPIRSHAVARAQAVLSGTPHEQVTQAIAMLHRRGALNPDAVGSQHAAASVPESGGTSGPALAVLVEPDRHDLGHSLLGAAAHLAYEVGGHVVALSFDSVHADAELGAHGADAIVRVQGARVEEDAAEAVASWVLDNHPVTAMFAFSTTWGREVMARVAARLGAGLTGDARARPGPPPRRLEARVRRADGGRDRVSLGAPDGDGPTRRPGDRGPETSRGADHRADGRGAKGPTRRHPARAERRCRRARGGTRHRGGGRRCPA